MIAHDNFLFGERYMYVKEVISYGGAWANLQEQFPEQLHSIYAIADRLTREVMKAQPAPKYMANTNRLHWSQIDQGVHNEIEQAGWALVLKSEHRRARLSMAGLGFIQDQTSLAFIRTRDSMNRWLYTITPLATKHGFVRIPVALVFDDQDLAQLLGRPSVPLSVYSRLKMDLQALAPLSNPSPFLIIALSLDEAKAQIIEIPTDVDVQSVSVVVNRAIEFPPEYRQAGIGILSYFSTVLEEKYPGNDARVRIEQDGLSVRLIVESDNGNREVIERALQEYEMVVRGDAPVDSLFQNKVKIVELQTELRIAQLRVENQRDIISLQGEEIKSLRQLIGHSLSQSHPIAVNVSPVICVSNAVQIRNDVPEILLQLQRLSELTTDNSQMQLRLLDMQDAFAALGEKSTPDDAKASSAMKKLKAWLDDAAAVGSSTNSFLQKVGDGLEVVQKLAKHYNAVAEWCGAPQVPRIFLGED
ncbi:hypothetical protein [Herbaspirillum sp. 1130]|uniref:hypothetical protein n=1 Tax=Herbaspirillum sp. 1130 TaxID=2806562 RepID=UPI001AE1D5BD|nr:hypothetical protein [Herbaspirillum sp. 1130]MBP1316587.1 hypothetical protein [Herbaspirillum sp. 1130]